MFMFGFYAYSILQFALLFDYLFFSSSSFVDFLYTESSSATFYKDFILFFIIYSFVGIIASVLSYYFLDDFDNTKN